MSPVAVPAQAAQKPKLRTRFRKAKTYEPIYTGGPVALTPDGAWIVTTVGEDVVVTEVETGEQVHRITGDSEDVTALALTPSGAHLIVVSRSLHMRVYTLPTFELVRTTARVHDAPVIVMACDPTSTLVATGSADSTVKVWDIERGFCTHFLRGHGGVISALTFNFPDPFGLSSNADAKGKEIPGRPGGQRTMELVSGADDTKIRIWNLQTSKCVAVLDGHVSVVRGLSCSSEGTHLVSGSRDQVVIVWDLVKRRQLRTVPVYESLETVGLLEETSIVGDLEAAEGALTSSSGSPRRMFYTGGQQGLVKLFDLDTGKAVLTQPSSSRALKDEHGIADIIFTRSSNTLTAIHQDQNIQTLSVEHGLRRVRQLVGYNDEIIDALFLSSSTQSSSDTGISADTALALATNSDELRIYSTSRFDVELLSGHKDIVLCLAASADRRLLASGSKDRTARVWGQRRRPAGSSVKVEVEPEWACLAVCEGHAESVGAVAMAKRDSGFLFTASQDRTVKMWDLTEVLGTDAMPDEPRRLRSLMTQKIHDKDINSLDLAPNDKLLASASQDRTAKVFAIERSVSQGGAAQARLKLLGICKGHKRGVWTVKFSPVDRCIATGGGDRTIKLWSLEDFSCVKTFEGHTNSVLRVDFLTAGMQMLSCASDGLVKLWNVRDEECVTTMDNHTERIWGLAVGRDESVVVSAGADSVVTFWEDYTEQEEEEKAAAFEDLVSKEQDFQNFLSVKDYRNAIILALSMDQPRRLLNLFNTAAGSRSDDLAQEDDEHTMASSALASARNGDIANGPASSRSITGVLAVDEVIRTLNPSDLIRLLGHVRDWNTSSKTNGVAQRILHAILRYHQAEKLEKAFQEEAQAASADGTVALPGTTKKAAGGKPATLKDALDALLPYTERHFARADRQVQESFIVEYTLNAMDFLLE